MHRIEHDIKTGKTKTVELSAEEESEASSNKIEWEKAEVIRIELQLPPLQDQIDAIFSGGKTASDMKAKIDAIKEKFKL